MDADYKSWKKFKGNDIPSSLELFDDIYDFISKEDKIIDLGCGFGKTCMELFSEGYKHITGIDINQTGIEFAQKYYDTSQIDEYPTFIKDDVTAISLPDNCFDFGIMQALLTTITKQEEREKIFEEVKRILVDNAYLYMAIFTQTWHSAYYRERYIKGLEVTGEEGSFPAYNKKTGELDYVAHHYSEKEIVELLSTANFEIKRFRYEVFTTRSGNKMNGMLVIAQNRK